MIHWGCFFGLSLCSLPFISVELDFIKKYLNYLQFSCHDGITNPAAAIFKNELYIYIYCIFSTRQAALMMRF